MCAFMCLNFDSVTKIKFEKNLDFKNNTHVK